MPPLHEIVRRNILAFLDAQGITRAELSRRSGVTEASISYFLDRSRPEITTKTLDRLAAGLGVPPALLVQDIKEGGHADILRLWRAMDGMPEGERRRIIEDTELRRAYIEHPDLLERVKRRSG